MGDQPEDVAGEIKGLQRCINDLISLFALPAMWSGGEPSQIVHTLLDALLRMLQLDLVYARLQDSPGQAPMEMVRLAQSPRRTAQAHEIGKVLKHVLEADPQESPALMPNPVGDGDLSIMPMELGLQGDVGVIIAGSVRADFPRQTEKLILRVAANQASIGLQGARLLSEQRRVASELDRRVAQRTAELAAANDELRKEIADRKHAEEDLRSSEEKHRTSERSLRELTETIPQMLWSAEEDGTVNYCNQRTLDYTGLSAEEVRDAGWLTAVHSGDMAMATRAWSGSVTSGEAFQCEFRFRRAPDGYRWCISNAVPLRDPEGKVIRWFGTIVDLHDWREAQRALHAIQTRQVAVRADVSLAFGQKESLEAILQECMESIVRHLDAAFARVWTLSHDARMLELRASAGLYTHLHGAHSRIPVGQFKIGKIALEQKHVLTNDIINDPRISDKTWAETEGMSSFAGYPLLVGTRTLGVLAMFSRKPLTAGTAEALASTADLIAHGIERKNMEEALRTNQERLSRAMQTATVGEFAAAIAHEINQPLAAVVTNGQACLRWLAAEPPGIARAQDAAERIVRDGKETAEVVRRIRALFKQTAVERIELDVNEVIGDVLELLSGQAARRRVAVETDLVPDLAPVVGDRVQLQQLVFNLLLNAIEAMDAVADRPRQLSICSRQPSQETILVEIRDTGTGLEDPEGIFDAFFTTKESGMGMGLAICRSIINAHRGRLWAASGEGAGTTFSFTLPVRA